MSDDKDLAQVLTADISEYYKNKFDADKVRLDLIEPEFIIGTGQVLTFGASKYEDNSWQQVPNAESRYYGAAMRHLMAYRMGDESDSETGLSHLHHAATCLMFLAHFESRRTKDYEHQCSNADA